MHTQQTHTEETVMNVLYVLIEFWWSSVVVIGENKISWIVCWFSCNLHTYKTSLYFDVKNKFLHSHYSPLPPPRALCLSFYMIEFLHGESFKKIRIYLRTWFEEWCKTLSQFLILLLREEKRDTELKSRIPGNWLGSFVCMVFVILNHWFSCWVRGKKVSFPLVVITMVMLCSLCVWSEFCLAFSKITLK